MDKTQLVKVMLDYTKGSVAKYSLDEANGLIVKALVEANGGSEKFDIRTARRNPELFDILEQYIDTVSDTGLSKNDFFNQFVETVNLGEMDSRDFITKKDGYLIVSDVARGSQAVRRQRLGAYDSVNIKPTPHAVVVYDELVRILAGKADITDLANTISKSMENQRLLDVYGAWSSLSSASLDNYKIASTAGTYAEDELGELIAKVEADNGGEKAMIITTLKGARTIKATDGSEQGKTELYLNGYSSKWFGTNVLAIPQKFKAGTSEFVFPDNKIYVVTSNMDKPIKQVIGGGTYLDIGTGSENVDRTVDITAISNWGTGIVIGKSFGVYNIGSASV